eukprot:273539-Rhodomonas_salina.1
MEVLSAKYAKLQEKYANMQRLPCPKCGKMEKIFILKYGKPTKQLVSFAQVGSPGCRIRYVM